MPPKPVPDEEIAAVVRALAEHDSQSAAARSLGLSRNTFRHRRELARLRGMLPEPAAESPATPQERAQIQSLRDENARLRREVKESLREHADEEEILALIGIMAKAPTSPPAWLATPAVGKSPTPEVPVTCWSDWHFGEVVTSGEVNGVNAYNSIIAEQRVERLVNSTIHLCSDYGPGNYPGIVINLMGDFISGGLHPELAKTDEYAQIPASLKVRDILVAAIGRMADHFGSVFLPCVAGNHGRNTLRPEYKGYLHHNFDWLIYQLLHRHFEGDGRVRFLIPSSNEAYYAVYGKRFLVMHGDMMGVRGGDGIIGAIGPIIRGEIKTRGQVASMGRAYDVAILGHWHQELWLPRAIVANSLKGFDEFAKNALRAVPQPPSQPLFFVHPRHGITSRWNVLVDEPSEQKASAWVAVPSSETA